MPMSDVIGAIAGVGNALLGPLSGQMSYKHSKRLMENTYNVQNELQKYWFDKTNEYNTPLNQRRRLESAGLNYAALMAGEGGTAGMTGSASPPSPGASYSGVAVPSASLEVTSAIRELSQARLNDAQAGRTIEETATEPVRRQMMMAEAILSGSKSLTEQQQAALKAIEVFIAEATKGNVVEMSSVELDQARKNLDILKAQDWRLRFENKYKVPAEVEALRTTIRLTESQIGLNKALAFLRTQQAYLTREEVANYQSIVNLRVAQKGYYESMANYGDKKALVAESQKKNLDQQYTQREELFPIIKANTKKEGRRMTSETVSNYARAGYDSFRAVIQGYAAAHGLNPQPLLDAADRWAQDSTDW